MNFIKYTTFSQKKTHKLHCFKYNHSNHVLKFGRFGIKAASFTRLTEEQINSIIRFLLKIIKKLNGNKKNIKIWNMFLPNFSLTKLNSESRMGKGKGAIHTKAIFIKPGNIIFEFENVSFQQMVKILSQLKKCINLKIVLIRK